MNSFPALALWSFLAGLGIPLVGLLNAQLARPLGSAPAALTVLFAVGALIAAAATLMTSGVPNLSGLAAAPWRAYLPGFIMAFYGLAATIVIPRFGVGNFVLFILLAQVVSSAVTDHYGLLGATRRPVDALRLGGLLLVVAGLLLTQLAAQRAARG